MSVIAPPPRPEAARPVEPEPLEALIEEARQRTRRRRRRYAAAALLGAAIAAVAYGGFGRSGAGNVETTSAPHPRAIARAIVPSAVADGALTIFTMGPFDPIGKRFARVESIGAGPPKIVWRCRLLSCGQAVSSDWSPDGGRLALSFDQIGGVSGYAVGLHVVDVSSGRDVQIPAGAPSDLLAPEWKVYRPRMLARLGCWPPTDLDWSPDAMSLAYRCGGDVFNSGNGRGAHLNVIDLAGEGYRTVPTAGPAYWPSWSPDGARLAYSSSKVPRAGSAVYTIALDGSDRRLVGVDGAAPVWSPDGTAIAYQALCGVRVVPVSKGGAAGGDRSAGCTVELAGRPAWSPDGSQLAVESVDGIYLANADGTGLKRISARTSRARYGMQPGRPSWRRLP